jgi:hypothetical protein
MRNTVVYELAANLIEQVAKMRRQNASMDDVAAWPIPLRLDIDIAREFFDGLRTAPRVRAVTEVAVAMRTTLRKGPELLLQRDVVFPKTLAPSWLEQRLGLSEIPPRIEISLQVEDGSRLRAGVAAMQGEHFFVRTLARTMTRSSSVVGQIQCIISASGRDLGEFVPQGGTALPTTPWIFSDEQESDGVFLSASSFATQAASVLVALPDEGDFDADGATEDLGNLLGLGRRVVRLRGSLYWLGVDNDNVLISTGQRQTDEGVFELHGRRAPLLVREADLWLGTPSLWSFSSGESRRIDTGRLSWRSTAGSTWRAFDNRCLGAGQLALRDENNGFRAFVRILPDDFSLKLTCGQDGAGVVEVRSRSIIAAGVNPTPGLAVDVERIDGGFHLRVTFDGGVAPPTLRLKLRFPDENELSITVPYPTERAVFVGRGGAELERGARRSVDELAQVRAVVVSPRLGQWSIDVRAGRGAELLARLGSVAEGVHEVHLETYRDALSTMLANSANMDEELQLRIVREGVVGGREASMYVRRYDLGLRPLPIGDEHNVEIAAEDLARMAPETLAALQAEAISIEAPDRAAVPLVRRTPGVWSTDNVQLSPGPWLVLVRQGEYLRGRPFRITIPGGDDAGMNLTALGKAIAIGEREARQEEIRRIVAGLVGDRESPEREVLRSQLSIIGRCPAGTLDVVRALTGTPRLAVQFLLESGSRQRRLWEGLEELPFQWACVPMRVWLDAIREHVQHLRTCITEQSLLSTVLSTAAPGVFGSLPLAAFLPCVHEAAFMTMNGVPEPRDRPILQMSRQKLSLVPVFEAQVRAVLQRHANDDWWPTETVFSEEVVTRGRSEMAALLDRIPANPGFRVHACETPLVLAACVLEDAPEIDLLRLRKVRAFDPDWFDFAHAFALAYALGQRHGKKEFPFHD